jgi:hypothetical protein
MKLDPHDASILAIIADHAVERGSDLEPEETAELLGRIRANEAKDVAHYFVRGGQRVPAAKGAAKALRAWAERNRTVHASAG